MHLWAGIALGLYILMMSISGVAFLLENQLDRLFVPSSVEPVGEALTGDALDARVEEVYSDFEIVMVSPPFNEQRAAAVVVRQDEVSTIRYFDPYRGVDQGSANPWQTGIYRWLINFHDDLLLPRGIGRQLNGWGAFAFLLMMFSGFVIWWRGRAQWRQSFFVTRKSQHPYLWQFHSVLGFWTLIFMFAWGLSGMFLTIPGTLRAFTDTFGLSRLMGMGIVGIPPLEVEAMFDAGLLNGANDLLNINDFRGDRSRGFMDLMVDLHFGRYESSWAITLIAIIGLIPVFMFISGFILWWRRVVMRTYRKLTHRT